MLGYLVLIILQFGLCFYGLQYLMQFLPGVINGLPLLLLQGAIYGAIAFVAGLVFSFILKGVRTPGSGTAATSIIGGLIGAGVVIALDIFNVQMPIKLNDQFIVITGAILGYLVRR